jgi:hypothetical protein
MSRLHLHKMNWGKHSNLTTIDLKYRASDWWLLEAHTKNLALMHFDWEIKMSYELMFIGKQLYCDCFSKYENCCWLWSLYFRVLSWIRLVEVTAPCLVVCSFFFGLRLFHIPKRMMKPEELDLDHFY